MKVKIQVTQKHIDEGQPRRCSECPVSMAIQEKVIGQVQSLNKIITLWHPDGITYHDINPVPASITEFIDIFDNWRKGTCLPFEFELDIPEQYLRRQQ
jgi:hypothetical protein